MLLKERVKILKQEVSELNEQMYDTQCSVIQTEKIVRQLKEEINTDELHNIKKRLYKVEELMFAVNGHFKDEREKRFTLEEKYRKVITFLKENAFRAPVENLLMEIGEL